MTQETKIDPTSSAEKKQKAVQNVFNEMLPTEKAQFARDILGGRGGYRGLFRNIRSFLPGRPGPECDNITAKGRNCAQSFRYKDHAGNIKDCTDYCRKQCKEWLPALITQMPSEVRVLDRTSKEEKTLPIILATITLKTKKEKKATSSGKEVFLEIYRYKNSWWISKKKEFRILNTPPPVLTPMQRVQNRYLLQDFRTKDLTDVIFKSNLGNPVPPELVIKELTDSICNLSQEDSDKVHITISLWVDFGGDADIWENWKFKTPKVQGFPVVGQTYFQPLLFWDSDYVEQKDSMLNVNYSEYLFVPRFQKR
jgi:hypothetical protein